MRFQRKFRVQSTEEVEAEARDIQRRYAALHGFFWLPCALCGREFGGHEWHDIGDLPSTIYPDPERPRSGVGICPTCTAQGRGVVTPDAP